MHRPIAQRYSKAIKELASSYGFVDDCKYRVTITGSPPRGKGLGSSSIDIASALLAIKEQRGLRISAPELFKLMCRVERSDYLFNPELIVAANPRDGNCAVVGRSTKMPCSGLGYRSSRGRRYGSSPASRHCPSIFQPRVPGTLRHDTKRRNGEAALRGHSKRGIKRSHPAEKSVFRRRKSWSTTLQNVGLIAAHTGTILGFVLPKPVDKDLQRYIWDFVVNRFSATPMVFEVGTNPAALNGSKEPPAHFLATYLVFRGQDTRCKVGGFAYFERTNRLQVSIWRNRSTS